MKKIFLIKYDNGEDYAEDYEVYTFNYCYSSEEKALQVIEELKKDKNFLEKINDSVESTDIDFWIKSVELVD